MAAAVVDRFRPWRPEAEIVSVVVEAAGIRESRRCIYSPQLGISRPYMQQHPKNNCKGTSL